MLFTRLPLPGETKTRLMPWLTPEQCAALHCVMLMDISATLRRFGGDLFIFYTPDGDEAELRQLCGEAIYLVQDGADLGERMDRATREVLGRGYASCLLLGSDIPSVTEDALESVSALLQTHDVVLAPTEDGGYWLVGLKQPCSLIFAHPCYGTAKAFDAAQKGCEQANLRLAVGPKLWDIDEIGDLRYYMAHPGREMPHTQSLIDRLGATLFGATPHLRHTTSPTNAALSRGKPASQPSPSLFTDKKRGEKDHARDGTC